ncbi:GntR family transcriptional regulator [Kineococcus indalonis]|uniref:GntR family transcriptional regulator n=1 Tax=Kineococcus indalonis TaxID=2696566 RepID=UPI001412AF74|nr:GntR family transcriptional regulator [Kineococcus indalonis]NAZ85008.1 FCD domain-containing protein [Kineococcus indalonis]
MTAARTPLAPLPAGAPPRAARGRARIEAPSLVHLAADAVRGMILSGQLAPGDRLLEERLTEELGISRPPLREALRLLQQEGLIETRPRRGSVVATLTDQDVYEILTLRSALERLAVELGVPVRAPERLEVCRQALRRMEECAAAEDRGALVRSAYDFHASIVALAGHRRLDDSYAAVQQQVMLCMARNLYTREHEYEDLPTHVARHRHLLETIEGGDPDAVLAELAVHGERSFLKR